MAYILKYKDKDVSFNKEIRFLNKKDAAMNADKLIDYGHTEVLVESSFKGNYIGVLIRIIGAAVIIAGIIMGIYQGIQIGNIRSGGFDFLVAFNAWASAFVVGVVLIGIAEIIILLDAIKKQRGI